MKYLFIDTETTGVDPEIHALIQLSGIVEIDRQPVEEFDFLMRPLIHNYIDKEALKIQSRKESEIRNYPPQMEQFPKFERIISKYVNKFDKEDKFVLAGYNICSFDEPFLRQFFLHAAQSKRDREAGGWFGSWFAWPKLEVQTYLANHYAELNLRLENFKLETVCNHFQIKLSSAHDALADVRATRDLYYVLRYTLAQTLT